MCVTSIMAGQPSVQIARDLQPGNGVGVPVGFELSKLRCGLPPLTAALRLTQNYLQPPLLRHLVSQHLAQ